VKKIFIILLVVCLLPLIIYAGTKFSADATVAPTGTDLILGLQGGTTNKNYTVAGVLAAATSLTADLTGDVTGNVTGDVTGNVTGNATTATDLADYANMYDGAMTDGHLVTYDSVTNKLQDAGAKTTGFDEIATGSLIVKAGASSIGTATFAIDASTATTITLYPGICPNIHNYNQASGNVVNVLPSLAEGLCFVGQIRSANTGYYWRLEAASSTSVCLDGTCGKNYVQIASASVANFFTCNAAGTLQWHCESGRGTATTN
jgi:hypothetical protein